MADIKSRNGKWSGRIRAREGLVSLIYQNQFNDLDPDNGLEIFTTNFQYDGEEKEYIESGFETIKANIETIDKTISENLTNWSLERLFKLDLSILRVAVYEIMFSEDTPKEVAINEAVEIAKKFGTKDSSKLINGILGTIIRREE